MHPNPLLQKHIQISEEALPAVHVPLLLGNDLFILTQQDVRKIEDTRSFNISKIMPNGDLKAINNQDAAIWLQKYFKQENVLNNQTFSNLLEFLSCKINCTPGGERQTVPQSQQQYSSANQIPFPQPMEVSSSPVASIEQQLQWNKQENTSAPFPMNYSQGTSTTEINCQQNINERQSLHTCGYCKICQQCRICRALYNKSTNTKELQNNSNKALDAREQLKKKKMRYLFN